MKQIQSQQEISEYSIQIPKPTAQLAHIFSQLKLFSKQRLDTSENNGQGTDSGDEIKGLKFISSKLAKLFFKNRKLPYNQISKILIDNFASQQRDQRNIKRRVYDAINVLVAAGVLVKKNNFIEMIKDKVKIKVQHQMKDKFQEELKQKQQAVQSKISQQNKLAKKHKLIKKLFQRNSALNGKHLKSSENPTFDMKKSRSKKRQFQQTQSKELLSVTDRAWLSQIICDPKLIICLDSQQMSPKHLKTKVINSFEQKNVIRLLVPYNTIKSRQKVQEKNERNERKKQAQNSANFSSKMQQQVNVQNSQQAEDIFCTQNGLFSLMDLLQFLTLNQMTEE